MSVLVIEVMRIDKDDEVGMVVDRGRLREVGVEGGFVGRLLERRVEVGEGEEGEVELFGEWFEGGRDLWNLEGRVMGKGG